jgi:hypothetical protein
MPGSTLWRIDNDTLASDLVHLLPVDVGGIDHAASADRAAGSDLPDDGLSGRFPVQPHL